MDNTRGAKRKLTQYQSRSPLQTKVKNVDINVELVDLFPTQHGLLCDLFAGNLATARASIKTSQ